MTLSDKTRSEIYAVGAPLLDSPYFQRSKQQTHHKKTTLYKHTMNMTLLAIKYCDLYENIHADNPYKLAKLDRRNVIIAALCHDLGMIGRDEKYKNDIQAWFCHPIESARLTTEYFPDIDESVLNAIRRHMFPITLSVPRTLTEWIIICADKTASFYDILP